MRTFLAVASCLLMWLSVPTTPTWSQDGLFPNPPVQLPQSSANPPTTPIYQTESLNLFAGTQPGDVTLHADRASLTEVLKLIARRHNLNLIAGPGISGEVTLSIENAHLNEVLDAIVGVSGHRWHRSGN